MKCFYVNRLIFVSGHQGIKRHVQHETGEIAISEGRPLINLPVLTWQTREWVSSYSQSIRVLATKVLHCFWRFDQTTTTTTSILLSCHATYNHPPPWTFSSKSMLCIKLHHLGQSPAAIYKSFPLSIFFTSHPKSMKNSKERRFQELLLRSITIKIP